MGFNTDIISATTISGTTFYGDGSNLTGVVGTFSGNTSGNPINELHVCNVVGCSPITFYDSIQSNGSTADEYLSIAFGYNTTASGSYSHAEGYNTIASGLSSHAEGYFTTTSANYSHAEGYQTTTRGNYSHAEGSYGFTGLPAWKTNGTFNGQIQLPSGFGDLSVYFPSGTVVVLDGSFYTVSSSTFVIVTKIQLTDTTLNLGGGFPLSIYDATSLGTTYPYQGVNQNVAQSLGVGSHVEGGYFSINKTLGNSSHAEGDDTLTIGTISHAEGASTITVGYASHAEGGTTLTGLPAWVTDGAFNSVISLPIAYGDLTSYFTNGTIVILNGYVYTVSSSSFTTRTEITISTPSIFVGSGALLSIYNFGSFMFGKVLPYQTSFQGGIYSHSEGDRTLTLGYGSHAEGNGTIAYENYQHVSGTYNNTLNTNQLFIIGKGTSNSARSNGFRVDTSGNVYGAGATYNTGADYAEYFESLLGDSIPVGTVVELDGDKIKICTDSNNAIGVISATPSVVGNTENGTADEWNGKYEKDEWGRIIMEDYTYEKPETINQSGETIFTTVTAKRPKLSSNYDPNTLYVSREERAEWNIVALLGQVRVLKNQQIPSRWIKMKDINDKIGLYLVK